MGDANLEPMPPEYHFGREQFGPYRVAGIVAAVMSSGRCELQRQSCGGATRTDVFDFLGRMGTMEEALLDGPGRDGELHVRPSVPGDAARVSRQSALERVPKLATRASMWYATVMMPFHVLFPDVARDECRTVTPFNIGNLPSRTFLFVEFYCNEPACDCRRVILNVMDTERKQHVATINHAFEPPKPPFEDEGQTFLDPLNPQSSISDELLDLFREMIAGDAGYRARLERHYRMWKTVVDDPTHPDHTKVRSKFHDDPSFRPAFPRQEPVRREGPRVGPNDPCPCGSGKKYKRCCRT